MYINTFIVLKLMTFIEFMENFDVELPSSDITSNINHNDFQIDLQNSNISNYFNVDIDGQKSTDQQSITTEFHYHTPLNSISMPFQYSNPNQTILINQSGHYHSFYTMPCVESFFPNKEIINLSSEDKSIWSELTYFHTNSENKTFPTEIISNNNPNQSKKQFSNYDTNHEYENDPQNEFNSEKFWNILHNERIPFDNLQFFEHNQCIIENSLPFLYNDHQPINNSFQPSIVGDDHFENHTDQGMEDLHSRIQFSDNIQINQTDSNEIAKESYDPQNQLNTDNSDFCPQREQPILNYNNIFICDTISDMNNVLESEINQSLETSSGIELFDNFCSNSHSNRKHSNSYAKDQFNVTRFQIDNYKFSSSLNNLFLQYTFDLDNSVFQVELEKKLQTEIEITKQKIISANFSIKGNRSALNLTGSCSKNFCFFCTKKKCKMFQLTYKYSEQQFHCFVKYMKSKFKGELKVIICDFYEDSECTKIHNLNSFLLFFMKQRKKLFKLLQIVRVRKLHIHLESKINLMKEVFHNFKSNQSALKIRLLPEFISLFFYLLNRDIKVYIERNNTLFIIFIFYFRSLEQAINIIARYNLFDNKITEIEKTHRNNYKKLIAFIIRVNFVELLAILDFRNDDIVLKYRYHYLFLFEQQSRQLQNKNYDYDKLKFLTESINWFFSCAERLDVKSFFKIYNKNEIKQLFSYNRYYLRELGKLLLQLTSYESYLKSQNLYKDEDGMNFFEFIKFAEYLRYV